MVASPSVATALIQVRGAGPTGSLLALALAQQGQTVLLEDPLTAQELQSRSRAYAITHSSRRLLQRLDLWESLDQSLVPFTRLDLRDSGSGGRVLFRQQDLRKQNRHHQAIGWILDHRPLMRVLLDRLQQSPQVTLGLGKDPEPLDRSSAALIVAADGPSSPTRQSLGIDVFQHPYRQGCLTAKVVLRGVEPEGAYELFRPEGPLAVLPMTDGTHQVVWSAPMQHCLDRANLADGAFLDTLATVLPEGMEPDLLLDRPAAFPQTWMLARNLHHGLAVLVGEAGHRCHPVGGQGLNLCWRDVETLTDLVATQGISPRTAARYSRRRWPDLLMVGLATDALVRLFSNRQPLLVAIRQLLLPCLALSAPLRRLCLSAMTDGPLRVGRRLPD
jgi:2-octaprenyl-6-methoxyphenol hydroxylase